MFYEPAKRDHGLPHDPLKALVAPRPIGWIGSYGADGNSNLAPYSFFNMVGSTPPIVMFSSEGPKDSVLNIGETGAFSCNIVGAPLKDAMNVSSSGVDRDVNEFELAKLTEVKCEMVNAPYAKEAAAVFECIHLKTENLTDMDGNHTPAHMVLGQVVGVRIDESIIKDGMVDATLLQPLARMGYMDYVVADQPFQMMRP